MNVCKIYNFRMCAINVNNISIANVFVACKVLKLFEMILREVILNSGLGKFDIKIIWDSFKCDFSAHVCLILNLFQVNNVSLRGMYCLFYVC